MIPKQFHWVWIGPDPLPDRDREWMQSWRDRHLHWQCLIWAEHPERVEIDGFEIRPLPPLINSRAYRDIEKWVTGKAVLAARSDIARYEIIAREGGVYLDTDVECFQPIDDLMEGVKLFVADEWGPSMGNYMFGAERNHPALWTVVRELIPHLNSQKEQLNVLAATGPEYFNSRLRQSASDLVIFPHMLFNPLCAYDDPNRVQVWPDCSYANHRYDAKWYDRAKNEPPLEFRTHALL